MGTGVELAAKRYGADPSYKACTRLPSRPLPPPPARARHDASGASAPAILFRTVLTSRTRAHIYLSHTRTHYMYQAYLEATPLLFPTLASLRRTLSRG